MDERIRSLLRRTWACGTGELRGEPEALDNAWRHADPYQSNLWRQQGRAVTAEETERQARSAVLLNRGMMSLSQVAKESRW